MLILSLSLGTHLQLYRPPHPSPFPPSNATVLRPFHYLHRCYSISMPLSLPETQPWDLVSRYAGISWLLAYSLFLLHALRDTSGFLFPDFVNLMIHEGGHLFFSWGGHTLMILGGTLGELLVPLLCGLYFYFHGQTYGFTFSAFWFFENFLYIGTYMKDARAEALPLVNGDIGDWTILFGQWNLLLADQKIGQFVRALGWLGMCATLAWLAYRTYRDSQPFLRPLELPK